MSRPSLPNIVLIGNYVPDKQESMLRFAAVLERELKKEGVEVRIVRPIPILNRGRIQSGFLNKWIGYIDKFVLFPMALRKVVRASAASETMFHICDHSNAMYGRYLKGHAWSITCHDLLAVQSALGEIPENPTRFSGRILQAWILKSLSRAKNIVCDSHYTADQVARLASIPRDKLKVIRLGLNDPFQPLEAAERTEILRQLFRSRNMELLSRYLFHIGGNAWYKNRPGLIEMFAQVASVMPEVQLVFAGGKLPAELAALVVEKGLKSRVFDVGEISHRELNALYSAAEALVFPSLVEGFGWPVVEAQSSACPVIASNRAPVNEITGDAAIFIDPLSTQESAQTILNFLRWTPEERAKLINRGLENSTYYKTARMIRDYLEYYRGIFPDHP